MKRISLMKESLVRLRRDYINEHSKFIHSSYLLLSDLDREFKIKNKPYRVVGFWDQLSYEKLILTHDIEDGGYTIMPSKLIAFAMGYQGFRNLVTGKESLDNYKISKKNKKWKKLENN